MWYVIIGNWVVFEFEKSRPIRFRPSSFPIECIGRTDAIACVAANPLTYGKPENSVAYCEVQLPRLVVEKFAD